MNDELKGLLVKVGLAVMTALATKLHLDPSLNSIYPALAADLADVIILGYGIYNARGMKKVPVDAHVTVAGLTVSAPGDTKAATMAPVDIAGKLGTGLIGFFVLLSLYGGDAQAQTKTKLFGGTVTSGNPLTGALDKLKAFTVSDLTAALDDARANNDPSAACWEALIPVVESQQNPLPSQLGAAVALQKARDLQRKIKAGIPDAINSACAPILWDAQQVLLKFGVRATMLGILPIPLP